MHTLFRFLKASGFSLVVVCLSSYKVFSQTGLSGGWKAYTEVGGMASVGGETPFWLRSNQFGTVPLQSPVATFRGALFRDYAPADSTHRNRIYWGGGVKVVANAGAKNEFLLPEAYAKLRFRQVELWAGRRQRLVGLGDSLLSSGFVIGSGNALPVPRAEVATIGYVPLGFLGNFVAVSAAFSNGFFNVPYIKGAFLHQKHLYVRFGKPRSLLKVYAGLNHQAMWGGRADYLKGPAGLSIDGKLPSSLRDFWYVVTSTTPKEWYKRGYTSFETYRVGNNLGTVDVGLQVDLNRSRLLVYHQHIYEDVSGLSFANVPDGLWGISVRRQTNSAAPFRLTGFVVEHLTTLSQSGASFFVPGSSLQGSDNYFNHSQYVQGWSYFGRTIGTPFLAPATDFRPAIQQQSAGYIPNSRVSMWYLGAEGVISNQIRLTMRVSRSLNFGSYTGPYRPTARQLSALLSAYCPLPIATRTFLTATVAVDNGDLYANTVGGFIGIRKNW